MTDWTALVARTAEGLDHLNTLAPPLELRRIAIAQGKQFQNGDPDMYWLAPQQLQLPGPPAVASRDEPNLVPAGRPARQPMGDARALEQAPLRLPVALACAQALVVEQPAGGPGVDGEAGGGTARHQQEQRRGEEHSRCAVGSRVEHDVRDPETWPW